MGRQPTITEDLLAGLSDVIPSDSEKDPEASVLVSKLAEAEKRQAEVEPSDPPLTKKPRSEDTEVPNSFHSKEPWSYVLMVGDRPMSTDDSVIDSIQVGAALSTAVLLPSNMVRMAEITDYENFALMMQHSVLHAHSFTTKAEAVKKELTQRTKEATRLLFSLNQAKARACYFMDKSKAIQAAQSQAEEKAEAAEAITEAAQAEAELKNALGSKEAEIKEADEKAYYKQQLNLACNKGYYLGWMAANEGFEAKVAVGAKSHILNEQASKIVFPKATSETEVTLVERSLDQTLLEIDTEIATKKLAQLASEVATTPRAEVELSDKNAKDLNI
ncbi:hypothetical protein CsSME_00023399 [Camellia sinensis var. sinensis]